MLWNFSFIFLIFFLGSAWTVENGPAGASVNETDNVQQKFSQEMECSRAGGICLHKDDCPSEKISEEGQCPNQRSQGAVCCHSLPNTETRCQQLGGHCREVCPEQIIIGRANDCPEGEKCCPLV